MNRVDFSASSRFAEYTYPIVLLLRHDLTWTGNTKKNLSFGFTNRYTKYGFRYLVCPKKDYRVFTGVNRFDFDVTKLYFLVKSIAMFYIQHVCRDIVGVVRLCAKLFIVAYISYGFTVSLKNIIFLQSKWIFRLLGDNYWKLLIMLYIQHACRDMVGVVRACTKLCIIAYMSYFRFYCVIK